jgi:hypothetical protein
MNAKVVVVNLFIFISSCCDVNSDVTACRFLRVE